MFHPSEPANKRIYVVNNFSPTANMIYFHTVTGRDITHLIDSNVLTQYVGIDFSQDNEFLQKQTIQTQIDSLKERTIQFSPDYSWEWHF
jgi:hypothetical protein